MNHLAMGAQFLLTAFFLIHALAAHNARTIPTNTTDLEALLSFKAHISDPLATLSSWNATNTTLHFCAWPGVACGSSRHPERVTSLALVSSNLTGTLSPYLANLTFLRTLNFSTNNFHGLVPSDFGRLSHLQTLDLSYNSLAGEIPLTLTHCSELREIRLISNGFAGQVPANLSQCPNLHTIMFNINQLTGTIPSSMGSLPNLYHLSLRRNQIAGGIPPSLGNATSLALLDLAENSLEGHIPDNLDRLTSLQLLDLHANSLSGEIPASLLNISSIYYFNVGQNNLSGELPHDLGTNLPSLQFFHVFYNQIGGLIPVSISNASRLVEFILHGNMFVGQIPENLGSIRNLSVLDLGVNQLESVDLGILTSLRNCSNLTVLDLSSNNLLGILPSSVANLTTLVSVITVGNNQISGAIPTGIGKLNMITVLDMSQNLLTGTIPSSLGMLQNLHILSLSRNKLHGKIPTSIGNLTQLNELHLDKNELHGSIPASIGNLQFLGALDLSYNNLNGTIPGQAIGKLSSLAKYLNLSHNSLSASLPPQIGSLINLNILDISENILSGEIPGSLGECQLLGQLFMQGNFFEGIIPSGLSGFNGIQVIDLSRNNLSGPIPQFLESFNLLNYLNLSFNDLEGRVPRGGVFDNASAISVLGNNKLCGGIHELHLQTCDSSDGTRSRRSAPLKVIIPVIASCMLVVFVLSAVYYIRKQRKKANPSMPSLKEPFAQISYEDIHRATDGFSSSNLLGAGSFGSVYKGIMDFDPNRVVAIKVLDLHQRGADKSFMAECNSLKVIRHRNLANIITVCSSIDRNGGDFKALIYEYMPNGSLDEWLHPKKDENANSKSLSLAQRCNILIDVASALDYLHCRCETPLVHCDLKPSNILLDYDMGAHIGDFGLARFLHRAIGSHQDTNSSIGIKGSIGYIAPEYGMGGPVTTKGDVYSYGVLLLEIFTGKRPTDGIFQRDINLSKYVEMAFPDRVLDIIDPSIFLNDAETSDGYANITTDVRGRMHGFMISILRIGLLCLKESSNERMVIGDILKELHLAKKMLDWKSHAEQARSSDDQDYH